MRENLAARSNAAPALSGLVRERAEVPSQEDVFARVRRLARSGLGGATAYIHIHPADPAPARGEGILAISPGPRGNAAAPLCEHVCASGVPLGVADLRGQPWAPEFREAAEAGVVAFLGAPLRAPSGAVLGCLCVLDDAPREWSDSERALLDDLAAIAASEWELRRAAGASRAMENRMRMLEKAVENMQLGVTVTDLEGRIVYTNPAEARMHGFGRDELHGKHARILGPPELGRSLDGEQLQEATSWTRETVNVRKDGSRFPVLLWSDTVRDADGAPVGIVTCSEDITERKRAEQALREVALRDPLTGLPNRVYFLDRLTRALQRMQRQETLRFAVLFLDLDRFKAVNDSLGHHVGDRLLEVIAARLLRCVRPSDTVARFGGDEFAVLLEEVDGVEDAIQVATRIQAEFGAVIRLDGYELYTTASIGIVLGTPGVVQPEYLWRSADMAMYRAKAAGSGRYEVFDQAMHAEALARLELETDLRRAVEQREFSLHYQPVVELTGGRVIGFEALLRWEHPLRGMIFPAEILPAAEETGLILPAGEWVLEEACRQLKRWQEQFPRAQPLWVGVNLSTRQLLHPNLAERLQAILLLTGVAPHTLKLEITESAIVDNTELAAETLRRLKALGVQLYLDDFGTGYSSLSYLHRLPLDALKIDRSFIAQVEGENRTGQLVRTILALARDVSLQVVAEGVSSPEQLHLLRQMRCDFGQGFLFAKPLTVGLAAALLQDDPAW